ncbi:hypothetical protein EHV15_27010 [Paenibacillus oralis]|uniref:Uncharacterized protein n=1 Tax=Paenibacillus oralis TaxID=2490856 RepID=A0A3P3U964_9BACL|nr:hypothetical protein [Paenibacillus oralis]RRJ66158.1 hypothetical protein EHV15_27010 [Paenibacillus oralis]
MDAGQIVQLLETVLDAKLKPLQENMTDIKQEMTGLKQEMAVMKEDLSGVKQEVSGIKQELVNVKQNVSGLKSDMTEVKQDIKSLHNKFDLLASDQPDDTLAMLKIMNTKLDNVQKDVTFIHFKVSQHELEINRLKAQ